MYQKQCQGCGKPFEALKPNRKWCSDTCGKRTRRRTPPQPRGSIQQTPPAVDPFVQWHQEFVSLLGESLPGELADALASDDDCRDKCTPEQFTAVAVWISDQFRAAIECDDWGRAEQIVPALHALMDDLVSDRVVMHLAARITNTSTT